ncbi:scavenger receptor cysteine-rich type 1 protein M130-like [Acanthochromis polyacanthus]|uniref:scavenger receptor cysteine-rich type 1 protein M130-like n=1 Tax=Acanthochromis polyacanthus TaxID=80966 RepID=UPI00223426C0|nr:scavenger receptor cysteine-rich type 1 protein M130-like [Acanthochromis polyacanthus]
MDRLLVLLMLLWSSECEDIRLAEGDGRCAGTLELKRGEWTKVDIRDWTLKEAAVFCQHLDCGSVISLLNRKLSSKTVAWYVNHDCGQSGFPLSDCGRYEHTFYAQYLICSDSVRLLNGSTISSGRLEVRSNHQWSSVCETDFDQQDAEVVCRELGYGAPLIIQGAFFGEAPAPIWTKEFQCAGNESGLLECKSSDSAGNTCSPDRAVGLACLESDDIRLTGGDSHCAGTLELKQGDWRPVDGQNWTLEAAAAFCLHLDCGAAVSVGERRESSNRTVWRIISDCVHSGSPFRECITLGSSSLLLNLICSDSVRLLGGNSLCSGRLEVKSSQPNHQWSSVCEAGFDWQDAEVVCRELGCGLPTVFQGVLFGGVEALIGTKEFQCAGNESGLLECKSSDTAGNTCSSGRAVGLFCSGSFRLVGEASLCTGTLELKHLDDWRPVEASAWTLKAAAVFCKYLHCGSAISLQRRVASSSRYLWRVSPHCFRHGNEKTKCITSTYSFFILYLTCSDSIRLLNGKSLCSGRLEVRSNQSNHQWSSVCEDDFDRHDAEVVCRELSCGAPLTFQGALFGKAAAPIQKKEFQCAGNESGLLECKSSDSGGNTCSPDRAGGLICSEPVRLVGGDSRCAGTLELKDAGVWRPVDASGWTLEAVGPVCLHLGCGPAVSVGERREFSDKPAWLIERYCDLSGLDLRECITYWHSSSAVNLVCFEIQVQPNISVSSSMDGVSQVQQRRFQVSRSSKLTITCSIQPQLSGGFFQLIFTSSNTAFSYSRPAVNHLARFVFPAANPAHQGNYSCVYHLLSHSFSSQSCLLSVTSSNPTALIIRWVVVPLTLLMVNIALYFYRKATRGQRPSRQQNMELVVCTLYVSAAEERPDEEGEAQAAEQDLHGTHLISP